MADIFPATISEEDKVELVTALQDEFDTYLKWKQAAQRLHDLKNTLRDKYIKQAEGL